MELVEDGLSIAKSVVGGGAWCEFDAQEGVCYNGAMRSEAGKRRLLVLAMQPEGTVLGEFWESLWGAAQGVYCGIWVPGADEILEDVKWRKVRGAGELARARRVGVAPTGLAEVERRGAALAEKLRDEPTDVVVCGDGGALRSAARLALWTRVAAAETRWIAVPCCPFNSVPFTVCTLGYASALRYCSREVQANVRRGVRVTDVEIKGDIHGWLRLGVRAVVEFGGGNEGERLVLELTRGVACARFDRQLGRLLGQAVVRRAKYAAPGIMLVVRFDARGRIKIEHLALAESMYASRAIPPLYVTRASGRPTAAMKELALRLCAPWGLRGARRKEAR